MGHSNSNQHRSKKTFASAILLGTFTLSSSASADSCQTKTAYHSKKGKNIVETTVGAGSFKTLAAALGAADLVGALQSKGPPSVFAPTDAAFEKLPKGTIEDLLNPENKEKTAGYPHCPSALDECRNAPSLATREDASLSVHPRRLDALIKGIQLPLR